MGWCDVPDSKVHGANMGPIWGRQDPGGPHVGPMNLVLRGMYACVHPSGLHYWHWLNRMKPWGIRVKPTIIWQPQSTKPWWRHQMETFSALLTLCEGNPPESGIIYSRKFTIHAIYKRIHVAFIVHVDVGCWLLEKGLFRRDPHQLI